MRRLELPTSAVRLQRSTRLSYIPVSCSNEASEGAFLLESKIGETARSVNVVRAATSRRSDEGSRPG